MKQTKAYTRLMERGIRPSVQRLAIMDYLIHHPIHPTIDDVYQALCNKVPTLSRTTVYNTLRMLSEKRAAQMITIDLFGEQAPKLEGEKIVEGNIIQEEQLYYKGICAKCAKKLE